MSYIKLAIESRLADVDVLLANAQEKIKIKELQLEIVQTSAAFLSTEKQELTEYLEAYNEINV